MNASISRARSASALPAAVLLAGVLALAAQAARAEITWSGGYPHRHAGDRGWQYGYDPYRAGTDHGLVTGSGRHGLRGHDGRRDRRSGTALPAQPYSRHRVPAGSHDAYREPARGYGYGYDYDNRHDRGRDSRYGYRAPRYQPDTQPGFVPDADRGSRGTERAYRDGYRDGYSDRRAPYRPRYSSPPRYRDARPRYAPGYVPSRD